MQQAASEFLDIQNINWLRDQVSDAHPATTDHAREAQNALRAAIESCDSALSTGTTINRLSKASRGKQPRGKWGTEAQDLLRAALLFAGAGCDRSLKRLAEETLPRFIVSDPGTVTRLSEFASAAITDKVGAVDAKQVIALLMSTGQTPRDVLLIRWVTSLTRSSAQSAERVSEIASALGVVDKELRKRLTPQGKKSALENAFVARNEIAHELDVTVPQAEVRQALERIRRERAFNEVWGHCYEILESTQLIINDVAARLSTAGN
jgi:hypothetical protein